MDPLKRDNAGVRATNHEDRIAALERRIFPQPSLWARVGSTVDQTITAGFSEFLEITDFETGDSSIFRTTTDTAGDTNLLCNEFGLYLAITTVEWEDIGGPYAHSCSLEAQRQITTSLAGFGAGAATASEQVWPLAGIGPQTAVLDTGDVLFGVHSPWDYLSTQPAGWQVLAANGWTADVDVLRWSMMVYLLPSDEVERDYTVF